MSNNLEHEIINGGDLSNYIVRIDDNVSYCINLLDKNGIILDNIKTDNFVLLTILEALAELMKINNNFHILMKGDQIIVGDVDLEFYRKFIKIDISNYQTYINYEFKF
jgi:hypothetical protein